MDTALIVTLVVSGIGLLLGVLALLFVRGKGVVDLRGDVDELMVVVERLAKASRRERMSQVRAAAEGSSAPPPELSPPPQLSQPALSPGDRKAELRRRLLTGGKQ